MKVTDQSSPLPALLDSHIHRFYPNGLAVMAEGTWLLPPLMPPLLPVSYHHGVPWKVHGLSLSLSFPSPHSPSIPSLPQGDPGEGWWCGDIHHGHGTMCNVPCHSMGREVERGGRMLVIEGLGGASLVILKIDSHKREDVQG